MSINFELPREISEENTENKHTNMILQLKFQASLDASIGPVNLNELQYQISVEMVVGFNTHNAVWLRPEIAS